MFRRELTDPEHAWGKGGAEEEEEADVWAAELPAQETAVPEPAAQPFVDEPTAAAAPPDAAVSTAGT